MRKQEGLRLNKEQIKKTISSSRIRNGLEQYLWLQGKILQCNVSTDEEFQRKFNAFYRVHHKDKYWQKEFYQLLETNKNNRSTSFERILINLYNKTGKMEASFTSKFIATINPKMPVIDKMVFRNLGLRLPTPRVKNRVLIIKEQYHTLIKEFARFLKTEDGEYLVGQFTKEYPKAKITKVKMLDFVLWQMRD